MPLHDGSKGDVMENENQPTWWAKFDERQQKEIRLSILYASEFAHGTDGHNAKMIIAKMAKLLDEAERARGGQ